MSCNSIDIQALQEASPPELLFQKIADLPYPVWLDSATSEDTRYHILSAVPEETICIEEASAASASLVLEKAKHLLANHPKRNAMPNIPFQGGLIGYFSYDLGAAGLGVDQTETSMLPAAYAGLYLWALIIDNLNQSQQLVFHPDCDPQTKKLVISRFAEASESESRVASFELTSPFSPSVDKESYRTTISQIDDYIHAGDVYQVNYAQHFSASYKGETLDAYLRLREQAPAPYSGYLKLGDRALLCHSPEQFLEIKGRHVCTRPIKGTAPRSGDEQLDRRNAEVLLASEKDRAENLMIVDLMRNDLGKHCVTGSVQTNKLFELKSYSNVHHLVSEIAGELKADSSGLDLLFDSLPAGSITGAPKKRAVEIIGELETQQRSFYCGNLGYASLCGNLDFNIGIRSMVADGHNMHCWGGGGIVADSNAEKEYRETLHKVGGLMSELEKCSLQDASSDQSTA